MKSSPDRLYELMPAVYRLRDAERGEPLRALLGVISEQVNLLEADIAQMYDNWFIETCEEWAVPYIADLVGYKLLRNSGEPDALTTRGARERQRVLAPRRDVANVMRYRRRKGTLALLELLAHDAANFPVRAVEFYKLLGRTQAINFPRLTRGRTADLRDGGALDLLDGPFGQPAHTADVRRAVSHRSRGLHNIPSVGVFVWRQKTYPVTRTIAYQVEEEGPECFTFNPLGHDTALYNYPQPETVPTHIADELNLPTPIRRRAFEERIIERGRNEHGSHKRDKKKHGQSEYFKKIRTRASEKYYDRSLSVFISKENGELEQIPREAVIPANLSNWGAYRPPPGFIAVDPRLGRIVFPLDQIPEDEVIVSYRYAFSADIGGGEYNRPLSHPKGAQIYRVGKKEKYQTINYALAAWETAEPRPAAAVIEIRDSRVYSEPLLINLKAGESLQLRAANRRRPVIILPERFSGLSDAFSIRGEKGSRFTLDGLLITGRAVRINKLRKKDRPKDSYAQNDNSEDHPADLRHSSDKGDPGNLCDVTIRHCTLVPGRSLHCNCEPRRPGEASIRLEFTRARLNIEHSIIGGIQVEANERANEPSPIYISDSILDATGEDRVALGVKSGALAYIKLTIARSTVIGKVRTHEIALAENSIFQGVVTVGRTQRGCMRFCYIRPGSRTPRRYECQPDEAERAADSALGKTRQLKKLPPPSAEEIKAAKAFARRRVEPRFNSLRYGNRAYCQLTQRCAEEIARGADDESEMGVFHDLYLPQRAGNLRARLDEFTPAGADVAIIYAD